MEQFRSQENSWSNSADEYIEELRQGQELYNAAKARAEELKQTLADQSVGGEERKALFSEMKGEERKMRDAEAAMEMTRLKSRGGENLRKAA